MILQILIKKFVTKFIFEKNSIRLLFFQSKQLDDISTRNYINEIQIKLDQILIYCHTLSLPNEQTRIALERINQLYVLIDVHSNSSPTITNGFHSISKQKVGSIGKEESYVRSSVFYSLNNACGLLLVVSWCVRRNSAAHRSSFESYSW